MFFTSTKEIGTNNLRFYMMKDREIKEKGSSKGMTQK